MALPISIVEWRAKKEIDKQNAKKKELEQKLEEQRDLKNQQEDQLRNESRLRAYPCNITEESPGTFR